MNKKPSPFWFVTAAVLSLTACLSAHAQMEASPPALAQINTEMYAAYEAKRYTQAAALGLYAIERGEKGTDTLYDIACSFALAGDKEHAFKALDLAAKAGLASATHMKTDTDLTLLHTDARWPPLVARVAKAEAKQRLRLANPDQSVFVTGDIPRFWKAFDTAVTLPEDKRAPIFQTEYLDRASPGMQSWIQRRKVTAETLTAFVNKNEAFLAAIRPAMLNIVSQRPATIQAFHKFKTLYPDAQFPGTVFSIGAFYGGGTVSGSNLLMSAEMYCLSAQPPVAGLSRWQKSVLSPDSDIPFVLAHEMIHFQQRYASGSTLLHDCIQEGSADFLGEMCSGSVGSFHAGQVYPYGDAHERELWDRFQMDKDRTDKQGVWLYSESGEGVRPDDLGYYMGYKICEAYYKNAADKKQAIRDMLSITDFPAFLKASGYAEKFAAKSAD